jgi:hypothetical protein
MVWGKGRGLARQVSGQHENGSVHTAALGGVGINLSRICSVGSDTQNNFFHAGLVLDTGKGVETRLN